MTVRSALAWTVTPSGDAVLSAQLVNVLRYGLDRLDQHERQRNGAPMSGVLAQARSELYAIAVRMQDAGMSPACPEDVPAPSAVSTSEHDDRVSTKEAATMLGLSSRQARRALLGHEIGVLASGRITARRADVEELVEFRRNREERSN